MGGVVMNYTKGKWELNNYRPNNGRIVLRTGTEDNDASIGDREIAVVSPRGKTHKEMKANAMLIAAAPEMYEALEQILKQYCHDIEVSLTPSMANKIEKILKKAKGE